MKKRALIGLFAIAAIVALRPLSKYAGRKMSQHCAQMASKCKEMMTAQGGPCGQAADTPEQFDQEAAEFLGDREPVETI